MEFALKNKDHIIKMYHDGCSSYEIAESLNTYSTKILRSLKYLGRLLYEDENYFKRTYSDAQKLALEKGRSKHPTEGKTLDKNHKEKIGLSRSRAYHNLSNDEKRKGQKGQYFSNRLKKIDNQVVRIGLPTAGINLTA